MKNSIALLLMGIVFIEAIPLELEPLNKIFSNIIRLQRLDEELALAPAIRNFLAVNRFLKKKYPDLTKVAAEYISLAHALDEMGKCNIADFSSEKRLEILKQSIQAKSDFLQARQNVVNELAKIE